VTAPHVVRNRRASLRRGTRSKVRADLPNRTSASLSRSPRGGRASDDARASVFSGLPHEMQLAVENTAGPEREKEGNGSITKRRRARRPTSYTRPPVSQQLHLDPRPSCSGRREDARRDDHGLDAGCARASEMRRSARARRGRCERVRRVKGTHQSSAKWLQSQRRQPSSRTRRGGGPGTRRSSS